MWGFLDILGTVVEVIIDVYTTKKPKLRIRLLITFILLMCLAFIVFLAWNCIRLFSQGRVLGGVILGALALIGVLSSIAFVVYFIKKSGSKANNTAT